MDLPPPDNIEWQARAMILEGHAPPAAWRPFIHTLHFDRTALDNLELLVGLTALEALDVDLTQVSDVSPLAGHPVAVEERLRSPAGREGGLRGQLSPSRLPAASGCLGSRLCENSEIV
jgi:hypothetical protein